MRAILLAGVLLAGMGAAWGDGTERTGRSDTSSAGAEEGGGEGSDVPTDPTDQQRPWTPGECPGCNGANYDYNGDGVIDQADQDMAVDKNLQDIPDDAWGPTDWH